MKARHVAALGLLAAALALLICGFGGAAGMALTLATGIELLADVLTGKQTNT